MLDFFLKLICFYLWKTYQSLLFFLLWTLDVSRTASYEITVVPLSVRLSLSSLKIGSLVLSDIVHDDSWPWYLVTDRARFLKKTKKQNNNNKKMAAGIWAKWAKIVPETSFFCHFLKFGSLVFLETSNNSL